MDEKKNLENFVEMLVKHKDVFTKHIKSITKKNGEIVVEYPGINERYVLIPILDGSVKKKIVSKAGERIFIVCLNKKENVNVLIKEWEWFKKKDLLVMFADPSTGKRWVVNVKSHDFITEKKNLKKGLISMYDASKA